MTALSGPGDSSFPPDAGGHTLDNDKNRVQTTLSLLRMRKVTRSRARTRTSSRLTTDASQRLSSRLLPGKLLLLCRVFLLDSCNLSWLLLSCAHTGQQIVRLLIVSGLQLVCPGCRASDVTRLLFPKESPQGDMQMLQQRCR